MLSKRASHGNQELIKTRVSLENQLASQMQIITKMQAQIRDLRKKIEGLEVENDTLHESLMKTDEKMEWLDKTVHERLHVQGHHGLPPSDENDPDDYFDGWGDEEFREYDEEGNEINHSSHESSEV